MEKTISVRIGKEELIEIEDISKLEGRKKSEILRDVIDKGIKDKKLELALKKFQNNEATASKASKIARVAHEKKITLKDAAVSLKLLTAEEFDEKVDPKKMV